MPPKALSRARLEVSDRVRGSLRFLWARPLSYLNEAGAATDGAVSGERWPVKTLTDAAGMSLDLTKPSVKTTIEELRRLKVPATWKKDAGRIAPVETTLYRVTALLMSMKREKDADIHAVIADPRVGGSMIVEFPSSTCDLGATPEARKLMRDARKAFATACGGEPGSNFVTLSGKATIVGVGFFDAIHRQGGVAPNGIELHPVIGVEAATCKRVTNP